jgi:DNA polymerase II small subunit/DNA polymerase delta subunit B
MKVQTQLNKEGTASLESGELAFLDDALRFLLTVLHVEGYSYVHNIVAIKDGGDSVSATGETYRIKQIWNEPKTKQVLIDVETLAEIQRDVAYYSEQVEQYKEIRNRLVKENNDLRDQLNMAQKYQEIKEEIL